MSGGDNRTLLPDLVMVTPGKFISRRSDLNSTLPTQQCKNWPHFFFFNGHTESC